MKDVQCVKFLRWALPRMHMRWAGFRKVRAQVCKRIDRRVRDLGLTGVDEYQAYLGEHPDEWARLDPLCRITISRFYRDQRVFAVLAQEVLPSLVITMRERGDSRLRIWSAGCSSGEEPYTLSALWIIELQSRYPDATIEIIATDADPRVLDRARAARYKFGSLKNVPEGWRKQVFSRDGDTFQVKTEYKRDIEFINQDIRHELPEGRFDLVLCRNLVFTYFDDPAQVDVLKRVLGTMHNGAALVIGAQENLPEGAQGLSVWFDKQRIYRKDAGL